MKLPEKFWSGLFVISLFSLLLGVCARTIIPETPTNAEKAVAEANAKTFAKQLGLNEFTIKCSDKQFTYSNSLTCKATTNEKEYLFECHRRLILSEKSCVSTY